MTDKQNSEKIILGIDPGTNLMGYGVLRVTGNKAVMETMGIIDLRKYTGPYLKLGRIFERVTGIIESYLPDEMAIEAPFFGKNVQSMLKIGARTGRGHCGGYPPRHPHHRICAAQKSKWPSPENGQASKEQVAGMLTRMLHIREERHAAVYGCHRRTGCRLLPFPTDGEAGRGPALPQLERFHPEKSG